jgi:hypothetical protein
MSMKKSGDENDIYTIYNKMSNDYLNHENNPYYKNLESAMKALNNKSIFNKKGDLIKNISEYSTQNNTDNIKNKSNIPLKNIKLQKNFNSKEIVNHYYNSQLAKALSDHFFDDLEEALGRPVNKVGDLVNFNIKEKMVEDLRKKLYDMVYSDQKDDEKSFRPKKPIKINDKSEKAKQKEMHALMNVSPKRNKKFKINELDLDEEFEKKAKRMGSYSNSNTRVSNTRSSSSVKSVFSENRLEKKKITIRLHLQHEPAQPLEPFKRLPATLEICAINYAKEHFPAIYVTETRRFNMLVAQLIPLAISRVLSWGQQALNDQQQLHKDTFDLIKKFHELKGNDILNEIVGATDTAKNIEKKKNGILGWLKPSLPKATTSPQENQDRLEKLKSQLNELLTPLDKKFSEARASLLPLFMATLACVADVSEETDAVKSDIALYSALTQRRRLLHDASEQTDMIKDQLNQVRLMIVDLKNRMDHIINVMLPSLAMSEGLNAINPTLNKKVENDNDENKEVVYETRYSGMYPVSKSTSKTDAHDYIENYIPASTSLKNHSESLSPTNKHLSFYNVVNDDDNLIKK